MCRSGPSSLESSVCARRSAVKVFSPCKYAGSAPVQPPMEQIRNPLNRVGQFRRGDPCGRPRQTCRLPVKRDGTTPPDGSHAPARGRTRRPAPAPPPPQDSAPRNRTSCRCMAQTPRPVPYDRCSLRVRAPAPGVVTCTKQTPKGACDRGACAHPGLGCAWLVVSLPSRGSSTRGTGRRRWTRRTTQSTRWGSSVRNRS